MRCWGGKSAPWFAIKIRPRQNLFMSSDDILLEAEIAMEKSVDFMVHEFAAVRTGKASPGRVEDVDVQDYGSTKKLKKLGITTKPTPTLRVAKPLDAGTL